MLLCLLCPIHRFPWIFTMMMMNPCTLIFCVLLPKSSESLIRLVESFGSPAATTTFIPVYYSSSLLYSNPSKAIPAGDFFFQTPTTTSLAGRDLALSMGFESDWFSFTRSGCIDLPSIFNKTTCLCGLPTTRALLSSLPTPMNTLVNGTVEHPVPRRPTERSQRACNHILHTRPRKYIKMQHHQKCIPR